MPLGCKLFPTHVSTLRPLCMHACMHACMLLNTPGRACRLENAHTGPHASAVRETQCWPRLGCLSLPQTEEVCVSTSALPQAPPPSASGGLNWRTMPRCPVPPTAGNSKADSYRHLWGSANGASCAFRDANGNPIFPAKVVTLPATKSGGLDWRTVPRCPVPPTADNSKADSYGHRWGSANGASCAFRDANGNPVYPHRTGL